MLFNLSFINLRLNKFNQASADKHIFYDSSLVSWIINNNKTLISLELSITKLFMYRSVCYNIVTHPSGMNKTINVFGLKSTNTQKSNYEIPD